MDPIYVYAGEGKGVSRFCLDGSKARQKGEGKILTFPNESVRYETLTRMTRVGSTPSISSIFRATHGQILTTCPKIIAHALRKIF